MHQFVSIIQMETENRNEGRVCTVKPVILVFGETIASLQYVTLLSAQVLCAVLNIWSDCFGKLRHLQYLYLTYRHTRWS